MSAWKYTLYQSSHANLQLVVNCNSKIETIEKVVMAHKLFDYIFVEQYD